MKKKRILFVCLGNICRSPTAESLFRALVASRGLAGEIEVDSAGTGSWHVGEPPDRRMQAAAGRRGYRLQGRSRQVTAEELPSWDLVVAMDRRNYADLRQLAGGDGARLALFGDFLPAGAPRDVPDPYYGGSAGFDRVLDLIEEAGPRLLERLREG